jgi:hypothetical protein
LASGAGFVHSPRLWWEDVRDGDGDLTQWELPRALPAALALRIPFPCEVRCGAAPAAAGITVWLDANLIPLLAVEDRDGALDVRLTAACRSALPAKLVIETPRLEVLQTYGPGPVSVTGLAGGRLRHDHYGASAVTLSGELTRLELSIYGSGDVAGGELRARAAHVEILGAGGARLAISDSLSGRIFGAGDVINDGETRHVAVDRFGRGRLVSQPAPTSR